MLCLLDVARIAYVRYGFTEAPGLVKFEQEIDRELLANKSNQALRGLELAQDQACLKTSDRQPDESSANSRRSLGRARNSLEVPIDATDELVMRYCRHKEEEAARKRNEELAAAAATEAEATKLAEEQLAIACHANEQLTFSNFDDELTADVSVASSEDESSVIENSAQLESGHTNGTIDFHNQDNGQHLSKNDDGDDLTELVSSTTCDLKTTHNAKNLAETGRVDSLDSGEGPTESASTGHSSSRMLTDNLSGTRRDHPNQHTLCSNHTSIPVPKKRANFTSSQTSHHTGSSTTNSELSSSRSSLLSNQDNSTNNYERQATSDLDGKVMRIAKSYYGKKATKDVMRLSEGKYRIADRIVFVRLLKGHRVMVRIGGGWDTLENFLFRHKSDPSQVIDPDNLLPLETKMPFDKTPQATPTKSASKLPYYRLCSSVSTNNLSLSNLSVSNHSLISSTSRIPSRSRSRVIPGAISNSAHSSPTIDRTTRNQIPTFPNSNNNKGQIPTTPNNHIVRLMPRHDQVSAGLSDQQHKNRIPQSVSAHNSPAVSNLKRPFYYHKMTTPTTPNRYNHQRPLASSMASTASASDIHSFDSFVRFPAPKRDRGPNRKLILK